MLKALFKSAARRIGIDIRRLPAFSGINREITPDHDLYRPLFSPWLSPDFQRYYQMGAPRTLVSPDRCYVLLTLLEQAIHLEGDVWECGVYKGGTAAMIAAFLNDAGVKKRLFLFDTFEGMPETDSKRDQHRKGDFNDTAVEEVANYIGHADRCVIRKGLIPSTFSGLESADISFAHIDVDIYKSILDCLNFIWPRLVAGGVLVFDDYGFPSCPGARRAVDEFFSLLPCVPLCLPTGQAIVFKGVGDLGNP